MDSHSEEVLMLTDPFFWEKAEYITRQASNGTLYLREQLPFDAVTLVYYLLFCPSVERIFSPTGDPRIAELREVLASNKDISGSLREARISLHAPADNISVTSLSDTTATIRSYIGGVDIPQKIRFDDIRAANEAGRLHEVFRLLSERTKMITIGAIKFVSFLKYTSPVIELDFNVSGVIARAICNWFIGPGAWVTINIKTPILLEGAEGFRRATKLVDSFVPKHFFLSSGPFKFVCKVTHLSEKYVRKSSEGSEIGARANTTDKAINLSYWETYMEPWLHLPALLQKSNAKIADRVLSYWSNVAKRVLQLDTLKAAITEAILEDEWNDDVWIDAHDLLTDV